MPYEGTRYDFNGQEPRPELFPVTIWTNADYNDGMIEAANGIALTNNPNKSAYFCMTGSSPEKVEKILGKSHEKFRL